MVILPPSLLMIGCNDLQRADGFESSIQCLSLFFVDVFYIVIYVQFLSSSV